MDAHKENQSAELQTPVFATLLAVAVAGIVLLLIKWAAPIIGPIMLGFFLAALGRPAFTWLQRKGWGKGWALVGVVLLLVLLGGSIILLAWLYIDRLGEGLSNYRELLLSRFGFTSAWLEQGPSSAETTTQINLGGSMSAALFAIVLGLAGAMGQFIFGFVLAIMLLTEWPRFGSIVRGVGNTQPFLSKLPAVADTAVTYFSVRAKINLMTGLVFGIAIALVGVDYPILWGIVTFFLSFVPYVGIVLAAAAPAILGLAETGWWVFWYVIVAVTVINLSVEYVVAPTMTGKSLSLSPTIVFIMFFFWSWLLGPIGMLVSMPITVLLMLVFASDHNTLFLARMLGRVGHDEPLPEKVEAIVPVTADVQQ